MHKEVGAIYLSGGFLMIDLEIKQLHGFTNGIEWWWSTGKCSSSAEQANSALDITFKDLMAKVYETSVNEIGDPQPSFLKIKLEDNGRERTKMKGNLLSLTSLSVPSIPASEVKGWSTSGKWAPCSASAALGQPQCLHWSPLSGEWEPC
jgi:hypothetical protein